MDLLCEILETASFFETQKDNSSASNNEQSRHNEERIDVVDVETNNAKTQEVGIGKQSLPEGIKIIETILMGVSHYGVFCSEKVIKKGTRFGPFTGRNILPDDIFTLSDTSYTWEVSTTILTT